MWKCTTLLILFAFILFFTSYDSLKCTVGGVVTSSIYLVSVSNEYLSDEDDVDWPTVKTFLGAYLNVQTISLLSLWFYFFGPASAPNLGWRRTPFTPSRLDWVLVFSSEQDHLKMNLLTLPTCCQFQYYHVATAFYGFQSLSYCLYISFYSSTTKSSLTDFSQCSGCVRPCLILQTTTRL